MKKIPLSAATKRLSKHAGLYALVDDEDYDWLSQWNWTATLTHRKSGGYAMRAEYGQSILMHRLITKAPSDMSVDHINGNSLDNRRANLRLVKPKRDLANRSVFKNNKLGYKGVFLDRKSKRFKMVISAIYDTPEEAARAYDNAARVVHGEFARLNFPDS